MTTAFDVIHYMFAPLARTKDGFRFIAYAAVYGLDERTLRAGSRHTTRGMQLSSSREAPTLL